MNLNLQSYKAHLVRLHKSENSNDLREFGQRTVFGVKRKLEETVTVEETVEYTASRRGQKWNLKYSPPSLTLWVSRTSSSIPTRTCFLASR